MKSALIDSHLWVIARATLIEFVRSKILSSLWLLSAALVFVGLLFGTVSIGEQLIMLRDFGLAVISLSSVGFVVITGPLLLHKELARKTVFSILAKPVSRADFVVGKFLGISAAGTLLVMSLGVPLLAALALLGGGFDYAVSQALLYILLELAVLSATAIFFSSAVITPALSGLFTLGIFVTGRSARQLLYFTSQEGTSTCMKVLVKGLYAGLPRFEALTVANEATMGVSQPSIHLFWACVYAGGYCAVLLAVAHRLFRNRNFV